MAEAGESRTAEALARYYDLDFDDDQADVEMYLAFAAASDGPILELMAGTGRVALPLALAGHHVVAVDRDAASLRRADARWQRERADAEPGSALETVHADVTGLQLDTRFGLAIVALNSLLLLDGRAAQRELLTTLRRHLARGGRAVIDVWLPAPEDLAVYDGRTVLDWLKSDNETLARVTKQTSARYDSATRTARITSLFDAWREGESPTRTSREDTITFLTVDELVRSAEDAGLVVETIAGDYGMGHFAGDSDRVVMVCRAGAD